MQRQGTSSRGRVIPVNDKTPMPFGKHKGKQLQDVPPSYLLWLFDSCNPLCEYIEKNRDLLEKEAEGG